MKRDIEDARVKNIRKVELISLKQKDLQKRQREQYSYYQQKQELREQMVSEVKDALREDVEKKKELSLLRKLD